MKRPFLSAFLLMVVIVFAAAVPAHASRDLVQFGSDIVVPQGQSIHDAVCFFCSVQIDGTAEHDIVVFFGSTKISTRSEHDVVDFFGDVRLGPNASVGHDVVNFFGTIRLGENASIGNDAVAMFGDVRAANTATIAGNRVVQPFFLLLVPLGILALVVFGIVEVVRRARMHRYPVYPFPPR